MAKIFDYIENRPLRTSTFNLSHERKTSLNFGKIIPIFCEETVPGDRWKLRTEMLLRMLPMVFPVLHRIDAHIHYFFVPHRLVWDNWQKFISGEGMDKDNYEAPVFPFFALEDEVTPGVTIQEQLLKGSLADHLGVQVDLSHASLQIPASFSQLPFRAYHLICNEYFADQDLSNLTEVRKGDAFEEDDVALLELRDRCWEKDYFTSARPFVQKGDVAHLTTGEVVLKDLADITATPKIYHRSSGSSNPEEFAQLGKPLIAASTNNSLHADGINQASEREWLYDPGDTLAAPPVSVNDLRWAVRLQEWLEKNARAGTRYIESILSHFGVRVPDYRLQRPEFIGGGSYPVTVSEVLQTSETSDSPLGQQAGHGISVGSKASFYYKAQEHGYIIGLLSIRPRSCYKNIVRRHFMKFTPYDFYFPSFANLGEQEILKGELGFRDDFNPLDLFGYQQRYVEYKNIPSTVHGMFRDETQVGFDRWHLARHPVPELNDNFVSLSVNDELERIFTFEQEDPLFLDTFLAQLYFDIKCQRPMPMFGIPSL